MGFRILILIGEYSVNYTIYKFTVPCRYILLICLQNYFL